jgi:hypothetical protein
LLFCSEAEGTRTPNHRIDSRVVNAATSDTNRCNNSKLHLTTETESEEGVAESAAASNDPELAMLIEKGSSLPPAIRAGIVAMVQSVNPFE